MKVATNITRDSFGGITTTNLSMFNHLHDSDTSFVGIELQNKRSFKAAHLYRHFNPEWFSHHIVGIHDLPIIKSIKTSKDLKDLEEKYSEVIKIIRDILKKENPDVVLISGTYYIPWLISIAAKKERIPIVLRYAGVFKLETTDFSPRFRRFFEEMEISMIKRAEKIIFPSTICKNIVYSEISRTKKVQDGSVIPNAVSSVFTRSLKKESEADNKIAFVGRYTPIKNLQAFLDLHKRLKKSWPHIATIVSNAKKIKKNKISKDTNILGSMDPKDLYTFYTSQGLIIVPSNFETFGNVPVEAACSGTPVLINKTVGCSDVFIEAGLVKFVVDFNNIKEVDERVKELCGQHILPEQINKLRKMVDPEFVASQVTKVLSKYSKSINKIF